MTCKIQWQHININKLEWESALVSSDVFACDPCFQLSTRFYFHLVKPKAWHQMLIPWTRTELNPDSQQPQMFKAMLRVPLILAHVRLLRIGLEVKIELWRFPLQECFCSMFYIWQSLCTWCTWFSSLGSLVTLCWIFRIKILYFLNSFHPFHF